MNKQPVQMSESEELVAPARAVVTVNWDLDRAAAVGLELFHHLHADNTAVATELNAINKTSPEQAKVAIYIPNVKPEQETHQIPA